jgi:hypothetical protein
VEIVSHQPVPQSAERYPLMRWAGPRDRRGKIVGWKIFRASDPLTVEMHQRTPLIQALSTEQKKLSIHQLWPHAVMVRELARDWTPERADELEMMDVAEAKASKPIRSESTDVGYQEQPVWHYLYFPKRSDAEEAGRELRERGFCVTVRKGADGENWLATKWMRFTMKWKLWPRSSVANTTGGNCRRALAKRPYQTERVGRPTLRFRRDPTFSATLSATTTNYVLNHFDQEVIGLPRSCPEVQLRPCSAHI